jgi:acyl-CoA synthetase (AMP-forming)/AMP-acid ligase II
LVTTAILHISCPQGLSLNQRAPGARDCQRLNSSGARRSRSSRDSLPKTPVGKLSNKDLVEQERAASAAARS